MLHSKITLTSYNFLYEVRVFMADYTKLKTHELILFKQTCIDQLLDVANLSRTETDADNRYALEVRRGELLGVLRAIEAELGRRSAKSLI